MQDKIGSADKFGECFSDYDNLKWLLALALSEGEARAFSPEDAGRLVTLDNFEYVRETLVKAFIYAVDGGEARDDIDYDTHENNAETGQKSMDFARLIYIGVTLLGFSEKEVWKMTPYKLNKLLQTHLFQGQFKFIVRQPVVNYARALKIKGV
ncbi:MAG: hypothetical protein LBU36_01230 [Clostridiales bacterium]|nr:hypothetical protein [Clostridiales bacterium]